MLLIGLLATVANAADFSVADMPCARVEAPSLVVNTNNVPWPFKGHAAKLVIEAQAQADAHAEECTRLLTVASSTAEQDEHTGLALEVAVVNGQSVSFDGRKATLITADAAIAHELPNGAFGGYGGYGTSGSNVAGLVHARNLGFLQGQDGAVSVGGGSAKSAPSPKSKKSAAEVTADEELAKAKAAAKAEAERKARAEAAKAAAAAGS